VADECGLRVIDVGDPAAPLEVGAVDTRASAVEVAVAGQYAYAAADAAGLAVIDVGDGPPHGYQVMCSAA
jgi:hypothetical protein